MTTAADLLKKNKTKSDFVPKTRRAWDFVTEDTSTNNNTSKAEVSSESTPKQKNAPTKVTPVLKKVGLDVKDNKQISAQPVVKTEKVNATAKTDAKYNKEESTTIDSKENEAQTEHKQGTINTQTKQEAHKNNAQTEHKQNTNVPRNGTQNKASTRRSPGYSKTFSSLSGLQKKLTHALYINCQIEGGRVTQQLSVEYLASLAGVNKNSVKTTLTRLREKGVIDICESKEGRGGWTKFTVSKEFFSDVFSHNQTRNIDPASQYFPGENIKQHTERHTQQYTESPSSSSNSFNINTTTCKTDLPEDWQQINITSLKEIFNSDNRWGKQFFGVNQIKTIYQNSGDSLTSKQVQESIDHFAFGLKFLISQDPYKTIKKPGAILVDSLKSGDTWDEPNYINTNEQHMYTVFKKLLEDVNKKAKTIFEEWIGNIKNEKYEYYRQQGNSSEFYDDRVFKERAIKDFKEAIWPKLRKEKLLEYIPDSELIDKLFSFHSAVQE
jgi:hypothetical protein